MKRSAHANTILAARRSTRRQAQPAAGLTRHRAGSSATLSEAAATPRRIMAQHVEREPAHTPSQGGMVIAVRTHRRGALAPAEGLEEVVSDVARST